MRILIQESLADRAARRLSSNSQAHLPHQWFWDHRGHVDPQKEAGGQKLRLVSGSTHRAREYAVQGLDVDTEDEKAAAAYGVPVGEYRRALFQAHFSDSVSVVQDQETDDEENEESEEDAEAIFA